MNKQKYDKQPPAKCIKESQSEAMKRKMEARRKIEDMAERMAITQSENKRFLI